MDHSVKCTISVLLACILLLCGCAGEGEPSAAENPVPFAAEQVYALAYLGYQQSEKLDGYRAKYLDDAALPVHYVSGGDYYLIIPRDDVSTVRLFVNNIETDSSTLFYEQSDARPFVVQCNVSDIFPDLTVEIVNESDTVRFSPFISLENGEVQIDEHGLLLTE